MADIDFQCAVCEASFRPEAIDKDGKCPSCRVEFPTVKNKLEAMALNRPEIHLGAKLTEDRVRQIVREEVNAMQAEKKIAALEKAREVKANKLEETK